MLKRLFSVGALLVATLLSADPVLRVQFGKTATPAEMHAAKETSSLLSAVLGQPVAAERECAAAVPVIYVGNTEFAKANGVDASALGPEEYILKAVGKNFIISGGKPRGTLYGSFEFLERFAGVAWLDEFTTDVPGKSAIVWPQDFSLHGKPAMRFREIYVNRCSDPAGRIAFKAHSRQNLLWEEEAALDSLRKVWELQNVFGAPGAVHTLYNYTKNWDSSMAGCFALRPDGKRPRAVSGSGPGQVCFSDSRVRAKIVSQLKSFIAADRAKSPDNPPVIYNLSFNDTRDYCYCPECLKREKKYGSYAGTLLEYWNAVAENVGAEYPDVVIQGIAYLFTEQPPRGIVPAKNLSIVIAVSPWSATPCRTMAPLTSPVNRKSLGNLKSWCALGGSGAVWNYWILFGPDVSCNTGMVPLPAIEKNMKLFHQLGVDYAFSECERPDTVTFHSLRIYVGTKLMWNPDQPVEMLLARFFRGYYGAAEKPMRALYDEIIRRQSAVEISNIPSASAHKYLDGEFFKKAEAWLTQAENAVKDDPVRSFNVMRERVTMDIARLARRQVADAAGIPSREAVIARLRKKWPLVIARCFAGEKWAAGARVTMNSFLKSAEAVKSVETGLKFPLDLPGFKDCELFDLTWKDFNSIREMSHHGLKIVDDPEAVGGKAMAIETPPDTSEKAFHSVTYRCGVYIDGKDVFNQYYPRPENEKYQWIKLDKPVELSPSSLLWLHNSWVIQQHLDNLYRPGKNNKAEIYIHVKRQGPEYIPASKLPNALRIDRIIVKIVK